MCKIKVGFGNSIVKSSSLSCLFLIVWKLSQLDNSTYKSPLRFFSLSSYFLFKISLLTNEETVVAFISMYRCKFEDLEGFVVWSKSIDLCCVTHRTFLAPVELFKCLTFVLKKTFPLCCSIIIHNRISCSYDRNHTDHCQIL